MEDRPKLPPPVANRIAHFNDFEILTEKRNRLPNELQQRYQLARYINLSDVAKIYAESDIVVGRSGANTVVEIALLGKPAVFIPLPLAQYNEQELLAKKLKARGAAVVLNQKDLTAGTLLAAISTIAANYDSYVDKGKNYSQSEEITHHKDACRRIVDSIEYCCDHGRDSSS